MSAVRAVALLALAGAQVFAGLRVAARLVRTARGVRITRSDAPLPGERISVIVPVLNEHLRLAPCLEGLMAQPAEVAEILVVDGGSTDGTSAVARAAAARDPRVRLIDAAPVPSGWNGKAHGLQTGFRQADPAATWILTIDADVRPHPDLARSLITHSLRTGAAVQGVATRQAVADPADAVLHPALLTTLVYRYGIPGQNTQDFRTVQANGQCSLYRRAPLERIDGFAAARDSRCEDVTIARLLARAGYRVGFAEAGSLVEVAMYDTWRETWQNWPRSLTLRDRLSGWHGWLGLADVTLAQGLPLAMAAVTWLVRQRGITGGSSLRSASAEPVTTRFLAMTNLILLAMRLGVLAGTRRAYHRPPRTYWLSPLADLPVALRLWQSALQRSHTWRGRPLVSEDVWSVT